jgi:hypothetical protein
MAKFTQQNLAFSKSYIGCSAMHKLPGITQANLEVLGIDNAGVIRVR